MVSNMRLVRFSCGCEFAICADVNLHVYATPNVWTCMKHNKRVVISRAAILGLE